MAGTYSRDWLSSNGGRIDSDADTIFAGTTVKWQPIERAIIAVALGGSYSWLDNERTVLGSSLVAGSSPNFWCGGARLHMEYEFSLDGPFYLLPYQGVDIVYTVTPEYSESGTGAFDLRVGKGSQVSVRSTKAMKIGSRMRIAQGLLTEGLCRGRHHHRQSSGLDNRRCLNRRSARRQQPLLDHPGRQDYGRVGAGFQLQGTNGLDLRLEYDGAVSGHSNSHIGSLRFGYRC